MAKAFQEWTVLPHAPMDKLTPNLWRVEGTLPDGKTKRVMTLARRTDGKLVIHNGIALEEPLMAEVEAFGTPAFLVVPNGFHRLDAKIFKDRYPNIKVIAPKGSAKKVEQVVKVDGSYDDVPKDPAVKLAHLDGCKDIEGVVEVTSDDGTTVILNDAVCNQPKLKGVVGFVLAPTGRPSVPRVMRWIAVKDRDALGAHLKRLAATPGLKRVIVSHGEMMTAAPHKALDAVGAELIAG